MEQVVGSGVSAVEHPIGCGQPGVVRPVKSKPTVSLPANPGDFGLESDVNALHIQSSMHGALQDDSIKSELRHAVDTLDQVSIEKPVYLVWWVCQGRANVLAEPLEMTRSNFRELPDDRVVHLERTVYTISKLANESRRVDVGAERSQVVARIVVAGVDSRLVGKGRSLQAVGPAIEEYSAQPEVAGGCECEVGPVEPCPDNRQVEALSPGGTGGLFRASPHYQTT